LNEKRIKVIELPKSKVPLIIPIKFPTSTDFKRASNIEKYLIDLYKYAILKEERKGIHVSDLDFPRKAIFDKLYPMEPSEQDIMRWIRGKSLHELFVKIFENNPNVKVEEETIFLREGIELYATPDVLLKISGMVMPIIMEFKTTLCEIRNNPLPYSHWVNRLLNYMSLHNTSLGVLAVQILDTDKLKCFISPKLTEEQLEMRRQMIFYQVREINDMLRKKVNYFDLCPKWRCRTCPHIPRCYASLEELKKRKE